MFCLWGSLLCFKASAAPRLLLFFFPLLFLTDIIWFSVFKVHISQLHGTAAAWTSDSLPEVVIGLEAGEGDADTLILLHHWLGCLLSFLEFNNLLWEVPENFVHSLASLSAWTEVLTAHIKRIPIFEIFLHLTYLSASSRGICLFGISHLFPVITMGVSGGRNFWSSFTQMFTLAQDSRSVMSYTINAPTISVILCVSHLQHLDNRPYWGHDIVLDQRCPRCWAVPCHLQPILSGWGNWHRWYWSICRRSCPCRNATSEMSFQHELSPFNIQYHTFSEHDDFEGAQLFLHSLIL